MCFSPTPPFFNQTPPNPQKKKKHPKTTHPPKPPTPNPFLAHRLQHIAHGLPTHGVRLGLLRAVRAARLEALREDLRRMKSVEAVRRWVSVGFFRVFGKGPREKCGFCLEKEVGRMGS